MLEGSLTSKADPRGHGMTAGSWRPSSCPRARPTSPTSSHILGIAYARGPAGRLARLVKLADLDDHLARPWAAGDPPYAWARRHVAVGSARVDYSSSRPSARARVTASEREDASSLR